MQSFFMHIRIPSNNSGFTLVELLIGMTIFAIGMTGIYALLTNTMSHASHSRHEVVVANLLREELELMKNTRDTNIRNFLPWDRVRDTNTTTTFSSGIFLIENDFSFSSIWIDKTTWDIQKSPVLYRDVTAEFSGKNTLAEKFDIARLVLDTSGKYVHTRAGINGTVTPYATYLIVSPMEFRDENDTLIKIQDNGKPQGYILDARVIVHSYGVYREYDAKDAITDWIR